MYLLRARGHVKNINISVYLFNAANYLPLKALFKLANPDASRNSARRDADMIVIRRLRSIIHYVIISAVQIYTQLHTA